MCSFFLYKHLFRRGKQQTEVHKVTRVTTRPELTRTRPSLWPSGIGSGLRRNRLWVRFLAVSDIYPMCIEPTITWVHSGFSGYIWLDTKSVFNKKPARLGLTTELYQRRWLSEWVAPLDRPYCNTRYDQSQGRRASTLECIGSISRRRFRARPSVRN